MSQTTKLENCVRRVEVMDVDTSDLCSTVDQDVTNQLTWLYPVPGDITSYGYYTLEAGKIILGYFSQGRTRSKKYGFTDTEPDAVVIRHSVRIFRITMTEKCTEFNITTFSFLNTMCTGGFHRKLDTRQFFKFE